MDTDKPYRKSLTSKMQEILDKTNKQEYNRETQPSNGKNTKER